MTRNNNATTAEKKAEGNQIAWVQCPSCNRLIYRAELESNAKICPHCNYYFRMSAYERIRLLVDDGSFREFNENVLSVDILNFVSVESYKEKYEKERSKTKINEAIVTGEARIGKNPVILGVLDFNFLGGSMGSVVGEKVTSAIERAIKKKLPLIIVSASGGARMQEGIFSLMQMAKTSAALARLSRHKIPYISILTDPTTGGVAASFAMLGDINIGEAGSLIGFAGPRVIEQTTKQSLPEGFQRAEFLLNHGMLDIVVTRKEMRPLLIKILNFFAKRKQ